MTQHKITLLLDPYPWRSRQQLGPIDAETHNDSQLKQVNNPELDYLLWIEGRCTYAIGLDSPFMYPKRYTLPSTKTNFDTGYKKQSVCWG